MPRSVPEWIGATPNTAIPPRVKVRVFERAGGKCQECGVKIRQGMVWECDHVVALVNGGANAESNLECVCKPCHGLRTREDVAEKATLAKKRKKALGVSKSRSRPMPGTRASGIRKRMNGTVEKWK